MSFGTMQRLGSIGTCLAGMLLAAVLRADEPPAPPAVVEPLPSAVLRLPAVAAEVNVAQPPTPLSLEEVLASVDQSYPLLAAALQQREIAAGERIAARGAYDLNVSAENFVGAPGYYQTNRAELRLEQNTLPGGKVFGGYRIGRGSFEPWYQERQTNDGGEFKLGFEQSLLQGLAIDKRRLGLRKADLARAAAEPSIDKQRIYFLEYAAFSYWKWVAAGQAYVVARDVLKLAEERVEGIEARIRAGILKEIERVDNRRLIVTRQAKWIEADRKFRQAAVELSLYLRDAYGRPVLVPAERLPWFPEPQSPDETQFAADEAFALSMRPEPRYLRIERDKFFVELQYLRNQTLPTLDAVVVAGQDVGAPTSPKKDKSPFEMQTGLVFEVPLQRRYASGRTQALEAELARIRSELNFAEDRVVADVRYAVAGLQTAYQEYLRARESVELTYQMQVAEQKNFDLGNSNILFVNLREQATAEARLLAIDAVEQFYFAVAEYRAALGIDSGIVSAP